MKPKIEANKFDWKACKILILKSSQKCLYKINSTFPKAELSIRSQVTSKIFTSNAC